MFKKFWFKLIDKFTVGFEQTHNFFSLHHDRKKHFFIEEEINPKILPNTDHRIFKKLNDVK